MKYIIYITLKLYDKKRTLGIVINKVVNTKGRNDCGPKNIFPLQKNNLHHSMSRISFVIIYIKKINKI